MDPLCAAVDVFCRTIWRLMAATVAVSIVIVTLVPLRLFHCNIPQYSHRFGHQCRPSNQVQLSDKEMYSVEGEYSAGEVLALQPKNVASTLCFFNCSRKVWVFGGFVFYCLCGWASAFEFNNVCLSFGLVVNNRIFYDFLCESNRYELVMKAFY